MSKLGVSNLKKAVRFATSIGNEIQTALADGKFAPTEAFSFIDEIAQLPDIINSRSEIVAEAKDIDSAEGKELRDYVRTELNIASDKVENVIDAALAWIFATVELIQVSRSLKA